MSISVIIVHHFQYSERDSNKIVYHYSCGMDPGILLNLERFL